MIEWRSTLLYSWFFHDHRLSKLPPLEVVKYPLKQPCPVHLSLLITVRPSSAIVVLGDSELRCKEIPGSHRKFIHSLDHLVEISSHGRSQIFLTCIKSYFFVMKWLKASAKCRLQIFFFFFFFFFLLAVCFGQGYVIYLTFSKQLLTLSVK